jgi:hypothetical protein
VPQFYFHVRRRQAVYIDSIGKSVENADGVVARAAEDAREIMRDEPDVPASVQWMEIADEMGNVVRTVPFETLLGSITNQPTRSPAGDRSRRVELGLPLDDFAAEAEITADQLHDYESTAPDDRFDVGVARRVSEALDRLERTRSSTLPRRPMAKVVVERRQVREAMAQIAVSIEELQREAALMTAMAHMGHQGRRPDFESLRKRVAGTRAKMERAVAVLPQHLQDHGRIVDLRKAIGSLEQFLPAANPGTD